LAFEDYTRSLEVCGGTETHVLQSQKLANPNQSIFENISNSAQSQSDMKSKKIDLSDLDLDI
jgi:hypothetical protein